MCTQVLKAVHRPSGQVRALKRIFNRKPQLGLADSTLREYQSLRSLDNCNIVRLLDTFAQVRAVRRLRAALVTTAHRGFYAQDCSVLQSSSLVLVFEYCCTDLAEVIQYRWTPLPEAVLKSLIQQTLQGLAACHEAGVHCEVSTARLPAESV